MKRMQIRVPPEANETQIVPTETGVVHASASHFDFPTFVTIEIDGDWTRVDLDYDFADREGLVNVFNTPRIRIFSGDRSRRLLRIEIQAASLEQCVSVIDETVAALRVLADRARARHEPLRHAVHYGALTYVFPHVIAEKLKSMRSASP